ncbi:MAG: 50S ribosomal protein L25 [Candidatus Omnitrophica bacterium CG07_land_8_20_14_0_80_50_8]|nr:MAG: hypothetical protein AUJ71_00090 [Candidatus Omnitrophica bacterium CG1_02_49_16]PIU40276.1 MAG: 50S ribosomal protein L25 [Candidatus Omnitrophica bacterium CG07_land_8_20_14_0_80_50_8]
MEQIKLSASIREGRGKQAVKKLRAQGLVPGIVYHRGQESVSIAIAEKELSRIMRSAGGDNVLIDLTIEKEKQARPRAVIIKEVQHHPVERGILHVDFNEISLTEKIIVEVEIVAQGEPIGVKQENGVLDHPLRTIKIQCLPTDIPKPIDVDVSKLALNQSIHVKDIVLSDKLKVMTDPELLLFHVKLHVEEKVETAAVETPELEVIREKKDETAAPVPGEKPKEEAKAKEAPKPEKK